MSHSKKQNHSAQASRNSENSHNPSQSGVSASNQPQSGKNCK